MKLNLFRKRYSESEHHAHHLEIARRAIYQCYRITTIVQNAQRKASILGARAQVAHERGDAILAGQLLQGKDTYAEMFSQTRPHFREALDSLEIVMAVLEYESAYVGTRRRLGITTSKQHHCTAWQVGELVRKRFGFPKRDADKKPSSPEEVIQQRAKQHAQNLERGLIAATQTDNLVQMVQDQQKKVDTLQAKAEASLKRGDRDLALQLLKEKQAYEQALAMTRDNFQQSLETLDAIMVALETLDTIRDHSRNNRVTVYGQ